ncbi:MAG: flavin reductase family protein [Spirochaetota bacterium]
MGITDTEFKNALSQFASGVTVVTYESAGTMGGLTVSSFCSLSLDPPLVLFNLAKKTASYDILNKADSYAVNILQSAQEDVSNQFANPKTNKHEFIESYGFTKGETGSPLLKNCMATLDCKIETIHAGGDHSIIVGRVVSATSNDDLRPLLYFKRKYYHI